MLPGSTQKGGREMTMTMSRPCSEHQEAELVKKLAEAQQVILDVHEYTRTVVTADEDLLEGFQALRMLTGRVMKLLHRAEIALDRHRQGLATSEGVRRVLDILRGD